MEVEYTEQLIRLIQKGDKQLFGQIVSSYQKRLYNYIYCILNNTQDTEDVLQDTFITALRKINQYKSNTQFSAWLYRIARNLSYDAVKKRKRIIPYERSEIDNLREKSSLYEDEQESIYQRINEVLGQMSFHEKNILVLRIFEEKSYEEIAFIIHKSQNASRKQYERARKKFMEFYNQMNEEECGYGNRTKLENVF